MGGSDAIHFWLAITATGASNAIFDLPSDGGWHESLVLVAEVGAGTAVDGVDRADAGGELMCLGVEWALSEMESERAAFAAVVSVLEGAVASTDIMWVLAVWVRAVVGVWTANDASGGSVDFLTSVIAVESDADHAVTYR